MKELIIDRDMWLRGGEYGLSMLYKQEIHRYCCLGLYCKSLGVSEPAMVNISSPSSVNQTRVIDCKVPFAFPEKSKWLFTITSQESIIDSDLSHRMMEVNDDSMMPESIRETKLTELFAQADIELVFIN